MRKATFRTLAGCVNADGGAWHAGRGVHFVDRQGELQTRNRLSIYVDGELYGSVSADHVNVLYEAYVEVRNGKSIGSLISYVVSNLDDWLDW